MMLWSIGYDHYDYILLETTTMISLLYALFVGHAIIFLSLCMLVVMTPIVLWLMRRLWLSILALYEMILSWQFDYNVVYWLLWLLERSKSLLHMSGWDIRLHISSWSLYSGGMTAYISGLLVPHPFSIWACCYWLDWINWAHHNGLSFLDAEKKVGIIWRVCVSSKHSYLIILSGSCVRSYTVLYSLYDAIHTISYQYPRAGK